MSLKKREFELRFAIKKDGKVGSASWYVWTNKDDIYIAPNKLGRYVNISLHSNRHCRVAITKENYTQITGKTWSGSRPALTSWNRQETENDGWIIGAEFLFAPEFLSPYDFVYDRETIVIESPCPVKAINVYMIFTRLPPEAMVLNPSQCVFGNTQLSTGSILLLLEK